MKKLLGWIVLIAALAALPAACAAENSFALPLVAVVSFLPWKESVTPMT